MKGAFTSADRAQSDEEKAAGWIADNVMWNVATSSKLQHSREVLRRIKEDRELRKDIAELVVMKT